MTDALQTSRLQQAIDIAEALSLEERQLLLETLTKRLRRQQSQQLLKEIQDVRQDVANDTIKNGSVKDFRANSKLKT